MAIGRYRDVPADMDDVEREVAAAQYPEGGLVFGLGVGIVLPIVTIEALLLLTPILCGVGGFVLGRFVRDYEIRRRRAERARGE
ncbi:hypothetical protein [Natrinema caseinilyticum]|uniref:hypothetical protein n=1 Tax=Natrinema caseinilyticum TaxID=2961570 RepID=UPI0020C45F76|nr:hypothetical protein [Natrinema caseinilyticum]